MMSSDCDGCGHLGDVAYQNCDHQLCDSCISSTTSDGGRCPACTRGDLSAQVQNRDADAVLGPEVVARANRAAAAYVRGTSTTEPPIDMHRDMRSLDEKTRVSQNLFRILFREVQRAMSRLVTLNISIQQVSKKHEALLGEMRAAVVKANSSFNGTLLWYITDIARKLSAASSSGHLTGSLSSPAFYTSRAGYKLCARIYLNGDGIGRGQYLSLFIVMMKGKYDSFQKWPFNQFVTFTLIDQSGQGQHVRDSFRADPSSPSFRCPQSEMNIASGCPLFMRLSDLHDKWGNYIQDDKLLIEIKVDTQGLENFGGQN